MVTLAHRNEDLGKLVLRWTVGGLLLFHGVFKLRHGVEWMVPVLEGVGLPAFLRYGSYVGEVLAPLLLLVGWQTRLAALVVAFDLAMAIALVQRGKILAVHPQSGAWGIELEMLFLLGALAIFFLGPGRYAVRPHRPG
jgi:putative oxidoreductase